MMKIDKEKQHNICSLKIEEKWFEQAEAANYLRMTKKALYNLCSQGKIKYYKIGRRNRYLLEDLRKLSLSNPKGGLEWE